MSYAEYLEPGTFYDTQECKWVPVILKVYKDEFGNKLGFKFFHLFNNDLKDTQQDSISCADKYLECTYKSLENLKSF